jgi:two-component system, OmpR family, response regulator
MHVLLAEDDDDAAAYVQCGLMELGHSVIRAANGADAFALGIAEHFDMIVLDRMMPHADGLDVLRKLRTGGVISPILLLTAKGGIADRVEGLDAGADDYLVKPFALAELVARLNALARRSPVGESKTCLEVGDIVIDLVRRKVTRSDQLIQLQAREFALLELFMRNAGRTITRKMFLEQIWGFSFDPQTNIVDSHVSRLRAKLRQGLWEDPIETLRGLGYRMRADFAI